MQRAALLPGTLDLLILKALSLPARFHTPSPAGRTRLREETQGWTRVVAAMSAALITGPGDV